MHSHTESGQTRAAPHAPRLELHYQLDDRPRSLRDAVLYSLQWMLIMMYPVVWGYVIVGLGLGFTPQELADYMGRVVLMIGVYRAMKSGPLHSVGLYWIDQGDRINNRIRAPIIAPLHVLSA